MSEVHLHTVLLLGFLLDAAVVTAVLGCARRDALGKRRIDFAHWLWTLGAVAISTAGRAVLHSQLQIRVFGIVHAVYLDLFVLAPLTAFCLLGLAWKGRVSLTRGVRRICYGAIAMLGVGIYATFVEPRLLQLETATAHVSSARAGHSAIRIGILADVQMARVSSYERGAFARMMAEKPDIIVLPGDLFQVMPFDFDRRLTAELPALHELLGMLDAPGGVYFVQGDVDWRMDAVRRMVEGTKVRILQNEIVHVRVGDRQVSLCGVELSYWLQGSRGAIRELENAQEEGDIRIVLAHRPDVAFELAGRSRVDLVLAGHTHGGQVVVPGFGPLVTLSNVPREVAAGGLHAVNGHAIYVSRGVGCECGEAPRVRFWCRPEISVVTVE